MKRFIRSSPSSTSTPRKPPAKPEAVDTDRAVSGRNVFELFSRGKKPGDSWVWHGERMDCFLADRCRPGADLLCVLGLRPDAFPRYPDF